jgi:hypothetical protein
MSIRVAIAVALAFLAVAGVPQFESGPTPAPAPVRVQEPSPEMRAAVRPVVLAVSSMSMIDRLWLQYIYTNAARVVQEDGTAEAGPVIATTDGLRGVHIAILRFIWKGLAENEPGKYPALRDAIESAFDTAIGKSRRPMTPELRAKVVELFGAIAWAGLGKDG